MLRIALLILAAMLVGGCATTDSALSDRSATLKYTEPNTSGPGDMRPSDWERQAVLKYHAPTDAQRDNMTQRQFRDSVIYRELAADDDHFNQFVRALRTERAAGNISADLATTILNGLATVYGGARAKEKLAALAGGVTSAHSSVEQELFNAEAMVAITSRMKAARLKALVPIEAGLTRSIGDYPLERGLRDLRAYADAGTLSSTLAAITNDAGEDAQEAQQQINNFTRDAAYRESLPQRQSLSERVGKLSATQVMALAAAMLPRLADEPAAVREELEATYPQTVRLKTADNARNFLLDWISFDSTADQMTRWGEAIAEAEKVQ